MESRQTTDVVLQALLMAVSGSDACAGSEAWTRFAWLGAVPLVPTRPSAGLLRSVRTRAIAEALWVPASLLPLNGARWTAVDDKVAEVAFLLDGIHSRFG